ncbi:MAG: restriction endonuclease subunit S [Planctomycetia bacterium]|nr:restriction endonuclease subunit S [Candidatus Brocadia sp.]QOJ07301.1 MAG: restriction endonuclease subunit S [Planctomycetia bacterium]HQU31952.1 restriction endonuclease subunit S [Candidatus Brocadia sapporoensis]
MKEQREAVMSNGRLKRENCQPPTVNTQLKKGYKHTEVGVIPSDWEVVCLGEMTIKVGSGITPTGGERVYKKGGRPFLRSQNVGWGCLLMEDIAFIDDSTHNTFKDTEILENDVFLNITGASIGRSAVADSRVEGGNVNQHVCIIRTAKDKLYPYFLNYSLLSRVGQKQIDSFQAGGNRQGLNFGQIRSFKIPLPTKAEQNAIATVLSDADALISGLKKLIAKKRNIKQGAMQELLMPREDWEAKRLAEIADVDKGEQLNRETLNEKDTYPVYNGGISPSGYTSKWNTERDTIIISEGGNSCGYVNFIKERFWRGGHCYQVKTRIEKEFLFHLLKSHEKNIMGLRVGSGLPNIQRGRLLSFELSVPKYESEKTAIAQVLSDMDAEIEALEKKLDKFRMIKQGMMQELLSGRTRLI